MTGYVIVQQYDIIDIKLSITLKTTGAKFPSDFSELPDSMLFIN